MASVIVQRPAPQVYVELSEQEALYVLHALRLTTPARDQFATDEDPSHDPVHIALSDALYDAGIHVYDAVHAAPL